MRFDSVAGRFSSSAGSKDVRRHDRGDAGLDGGSERQELDLAQPFRRVLDERQLEMRVGARVAVSGKMLAARGDALGLQRPDDGGPEPRDIGRLFAQRAIANHGILRVRVHVEDGRVVERDADRFQLAASARANRSASASSPLRPSVAIGGHSVNGAFSRATRPPSWSTLTHTGMSGTSRAAS